MQLGCTRTIDRLLQKSLERYSAPLEGHLGAFQLFYSPSLQSLPLCVLQFSSLVLYKSLILW